DPLQLLAEHLDRFHAETLPGLPPFQGGAAGLFGYDLCHHLERLPRPRYDEFELPDLAVGFYDWVVAFDHEQRQTWLISTGFPETEPIRRKRRAALRLRTVRRWLAAPYDNYPLPCGAFRRGFALSPQYAVPQWQQLTSNFDRSRYLDTVRRAIEYVHAGDCFQVNLAQRLLHPATMPPLELYRHLRERNAAPFAGFFAFGNVAVASSSPERLLRLQQGEVVTQPIKGTRPRGATSDEDEARAVELLHSAKDRAENVMIV